MNSEIPREIRAHHQARVAAVYVRQSTEKQAEENTGSTDYQRAQVRYPRMWGWPPEIIEVIDTDLGRSGAAAAHRAGYMDLINRIEQREIGAIFLSDMTRGGRNAEDWLRLVNLCRLYDVLIVVDGKVYDVKNNSERLLTQLLATLAEYDNVVRREALERGRLTKAAQGHTVSQPPIGYIRLPDGSWVKDPDPRVQAAVAAVFRTFREERTCARTIKALRANGIELPRRVRGVLVWVALRLSKLYRMLTNPSYMGAYHYGRLKSDPHAGRDRRGKWRLRRAEPDQIIVVPDHHEPYISKAEWDDIQATLRLNGPSQTRRNLGPGSGLCQGIIKCGLHGNWSMVTVYKPQRTDGGQSHAYQCSGDYHFGGEQCGRLAGLPTDRMVFEAVLDRLAAPHLDVIRAAAHRAGTDERSEVHRRKLALRQAQQNADILEASFLSLDPGSTELKKDLEAKTERAKREVKRLERLLSTEPSPLATFDDDQFDELVQLCRDLPNLWAAPTTTNQDRKQILRTLIQSVVQVYRDTERVRLRIIWNDAAPHTDVEFTLGGYTNRLILEMDAAGLTYEQIAARLNELGIQTMYGRLWERTTVNHKVKWLRSQQKLRGEGKA